MSRQEFLFSLINSEVIRYISVIWALQGRGSPLLLKGPKKIKAKACSKIMRMVVGGRPPPPCVVSLALPLFVLLGLFPMQETARAL